MKKKWSAKIKTHWTPPPGLFTRSATEIALQIARASDDLKQAMSRVTFYENRAGSNLNLKEREKLERVKAYLRGIFGRADRDLYKYSLT